MLFRSFCICHLDFAVRVFFTDYIFHRFCNAAGDSKLTDKEEMSGRLAYYLGEINMIHPFREGNGRTQRIYIEQLCWNNGRFEIDFTDVSKEEMIAASVRSANASNDMLEKLISSCLVEK